MIDGTGTPPRLGDVAIANGRIAAVGRFDRHNAADFLDARGHVVAPGFIDLHLHADLQVVSDGHLPSATAQGVTTVVVGQDGLGLAPLSPVGRRLRRQLVGLNGDPDRVRWAWRSFGGYLRAVSKTALGPNVGVLASHGTIRIAVIGEEDSQPTPLQLRLMRRLAATAMHQGAIGLSAGLTYAPAVFADDEELVALCEAIRPYGGFYSPHHRNYGEGAIKQFKASIDIGRRARVPVHLTHAHLSFPANRGRARELIQIVDEAIGQGMDVTLDSYPYLAGSTYIGALLPSWAQIGGDYAIARRIADDGTRERIRVEMETGCDGLQGIPVDWSLISVSGLRSAANGWCVGLTIAAIAAEWRCDPFAAYCRLMTEEGGAAMALLHIGNEDNVRQILAYPTHMPASDGIIAGQLPHPRAWGTFARCLRRYVRELKLVTIEEMIRKMSSAPAARLGLPNRGRIRVGAAADLVILDPTTVADRATYSQPKQYPVGIPHVIVNGHFAKRDDSLMPAGTGRLLRLTAPTGP